MAAPLTTDLSTLSIDERIKRIASIGEEITTIHEIQQCLIAYDKIGKRPICYDGFEPSGRIHIAQGLMKAYYIKIMVETGFDVVILIADIFAMLNNKLSGDMKKIRLYGEYMIDVWTVYLNRLNVDMSHVKFVWASEEIAKDPTTYWNIVMHITTKFPISRFKRCTPILGRDNIDKEKDKLMKTAKFYYENHMYPEAASVYKTAAELDESGMPTSYLLYAAMQCADIYYLNADVCQLGIDQKKVNMLAREYSAIILKDKPSFLKYRNPPIIVSHHMLIGLQHTIDNYGNVEIVKMSKSNPDSAIFMDDPIAEVNRKIKKSFCKPNNIELNPMLEYIKYIILPIQGTVTITKPEKYGGESYTFDNTESSWNQLLELYKSDIIHPLDLKLLVRDSINYLLEPVRQHFNPNRGE
jgi:tyrosyl-tRNA synthetase